MEPKLPQQLRQHLEANPQLSYVYLNAGNQWQFHQRAGYDKVLHRNEVLSIAEAALPNHNKAGAAATPAAVQGAPKAKITAGAAQKTEQVNTDAHPQNKKGEQQ